MTKNGYLENNKGGRKKAKPYLEIRSKFYMVQATSPREQHLFSSDSEMGLLSQWRGVLSGCGWRRSSLDVEGSCENTDKKSRDKIEKMTLHLWGRVVG
jgi:hypothetical protein